MGIAAGVRAGVPRVGAGAVGVEASFTVLGGCLVQSAAAKATQASQCRLRCRRRCKVKPALISSWRVMRWSAAIDVPCVHLDTHRWMIGPIVERLKGCQQYAKVTRPGSVFFGLRGAKGCPIAQNPNLKCAGAPCTCQHTVECSWPPALKQAGPVAQGKVTALSISAP